MTEIVLTLLPGQDFEFVDDAVPEANLSWRQSGNSIHIKQSSYDALIENGVDLSGVIDSNSSGQPSLMSLRIAALEAAVQALETEDLLAIKLPSLRVEHLPALTIEDSGTVYYSVNAYRHRPGLVVWDGWKWRRVKDGQYVHTNKGGRDDDDD